jgi:superoxide dismutase, Cu-Zn family
MRVANTINDRTAASRAPAVALAAALAGLAFPALGQEAEATQPAAVEAGTAEAAFISSDGQQVGTASVREASDGVLITLDLSGLPAGSWLAFHVHEFGECDVEGGFESAGEHFAVGDEDHGFHVASGPHAGDMPNQYVAADGTLRAEVLNTYVTLEDGEDGIRGRSLILHTEADDHESQPSGDAGDRLACAVIE